jgi:AcrR family transcriptional regulator
MPRPSQKEKIMEAALQCFARQGYDGTRIRDIAEAGNVSEAALYRHFSSKEAVAQSLFTHYFQEFGQRMKAVVTSAQPASKKLQAVVELLLKSYRENPDAFNFVILNTPAFIPKLSADTIYPMDVLEQIVGEGQAEGSLRDGQPNLLAAIFLGCVLRPLILSQLADPGALDLLQETRHDPVISQAALDSICRR